MIKRGKLPTTIYQLVNKETGDVEGAYIRAYHTEYTFSSAEKARRSNWHGIYEDTDKYRVVKYKVTYELVDKDVISLLEGEKQ